MTSSTSNFSRKVQKVLLLPLKGGKTPDQSQKLSNNQLSKAKFRGSFSAKKLSNLSLSNNQFDCSFP